MHRDVKSSNIMLDAAGQARLGDFGIARHHSLMQREAALPRASGATGHSDTLTGTFGYVAPDAALSGGPCPLIPSPLAQPWLAFNDFTWSTLHFSRSCQAGMLQTCRHTFHEQISTAICS